MRHFLVVDDNRAFAENIGEILRDLGDDVSFATDGAAALKLVQQRRFDAMVTDMRMPLMGGAELVHHVRRVDPGIAAIVVTAFVEDDALQAARREGLLAVFGKPVPIGPLVELLHRSRRDGLVVVVDDDDDLSDNLCEALRGRGFAAVTTGSLVETERLGPVHPFCALVDLRVPGGPVGEAMRCLASKFSGLPMLVVSAFDDVAPIAHEERFLKPFDTRALLDAVERQHRARPVTP